MEKKIAVEGLTLKPTNPSQSGIFLVTTVTTSKMSFDNKKVYETSLAFTVSAGTNGTIGNGTGGGTITASSSDATHGNKKLVLENDKVTIVVTGSLIASPFTPGQTFNMEVEVYNAGQDKMTIEV